ncbi:MAG: sigma-70 family RNA polymerase sigma factor [Gammaproteobacteria bacterium]
MIENRNVTSTSRTFEPSLESTASQPADAAVPHAAQFAPDATSIQANASLDKARIEAIIAREYVGLRMLIFRRAGDIHVAADLLNDAICTTWEKWLKGQIEHPEQIAGYVFQVAMNLLRNHRRTVMERPEKRADAETLETLPMDDSPDREHIEHSLAESVKRLLRSMGSQRDRTILVRFYLDEEDRETICREMGLSPAQFARVIHRARGRLRQLMEAEGMKGSDYYSLLLAL